MAAPPPVAAAPSPKKSRGSLQSGSLLPAGTPSSSAATAHPSAARFSYRALIASTDIDRLNLGAIPTPKLDWLQPHEGNLIEFLYRSRALQVGGEKR